jgi:hypothetical protein
MGTLKPMLLVVYVEWQLHGSEKGNNHIPTMMTQSVSQMPKAWVNAAQGCFD